MQIGIEWMTSDGTTVAKCLVLQLLLGYHPCSGALWVGKMLAFIPCSAPWSDATDVHAAIRFT